MMEYKGGIIEKLDFAESQDTGKKYHVTLPKGCADSHGGTISYKNTLAESKRFINNHKE